MFRLQIVSERKERMSLERAMKSISERMKQTRENQSATEQKAEAVTKVPYQCAACNACRCLVWLRLVS